MWKVGVKPTMCKKDLTVSRTALNQEVDEFKEKIKKIESSSSSVLNELNANLASITDVEGKLKITMTEVAAIEQRAKGVNENVTQWRADIQSVKADIEKNSKEFSEINSKSKAVQTEIETTYRKIAGTKDSTGKLTDNGYLQEFDGLKKQILKFIEDQTSKYNTQFAQIEGLLPGATSAGLAEAYQKQKNSYTGPMRLWSWVFILTILGMASFSVYILVGELQSTKEPSLNDALIALLRELPFFIPSIWLAAYASKQQSQYKRLQQEYAFKETNAKSFHGHKVQIEELLESGETDAALLSQLVAQLVHITSQNPSATLDSKSHDDSPPVFKLLEKYFPGKKEIKSDQK